jgi:hypothetical protein
MRCATDGGGVRGGQDGAVEGEERAGYRRYRSPKIKRCTISVTKDKEMYYYRLFRREEIFKFKYLEQSTFFSKCFSYLILI